jgi:hypothetical protein
VQTEWQAYRLITPLLAFTTTAHDGPLGRSFSLVKIDNPDTLQAARESMVLLKNDGTLPLHALYTR